METYYYALRARHCQHLQNAVAHLEHVGGNGVGRKIYNYEKALAFVRQNPRYVIFRVTACPGNAIRNMHVVNRTYIAEYEDVTEEFRAEVKRRLAAGERV